MSLEDSLHGPFPDEVTNHIEEGDCELPWRPNVRAPVFHGYQDIKEPVLTQGANLIGEGTTAGMIPTPMRIFYPTVEGTKKDATLLKDCGRYPLVVFLHGQCDVSNVHYVHWYHLPQQIARCGYVVVVPSLGNTDPFNDAHLNLADNVVTWMREEWQHRDQLASTTATVGHSYGAIVAGRLASRINASAFVSLSGEWTETAAFPGLHPLDALNCPALFTYGTGNDQDATLDSGGMFEKVKRSRHKVRFEGGNHFDYLPADFQVQCGESNRGPCNHVEQLAADFAALFLARYMPPPQAGILISPSLEIPTVGVLTPQMESFAGSHLVGLTLIHSSEGCKLTHSWVLEGGETGTLTLP